MIPDDSTKKSSISSSRPGLHAAPTVIPIVNIADTIERGGAHTGPQTTSVPPRTDTGSIISRRRVNSSVDQGTKTQLPHLQIDLATARKQFNDRYGTTVPSNLLSPGKVPTAPIAIPQPISKHQRPTTPLTGRPKEERSRYSYFASSMAPPPSKSQQSHYRPSSPLSPSVPISIPPNERQQKARGSPQNLNLRGIPKFHPLNFPQSESNTPLSPRSAQSVTSQPRQSRFVSDAQQKLQQYQRTVIANTTRTATSTLPLAVTTEPESPRLGPRGSPIGPVTPLVLGGQAQDDYLMAGSGLPPASAGSGRELVERLVQQENERRQHPEARSGSLSPNVSPAVSPAGGGL